MKESMKFQCPTTSPAHQQAPHHYLKEPPLTILENPIPHQGVMNTQPEISSTPPQMGKYQNLGPNQPRNPSNHNIVHTKEEEIILQTHDRQYNVPLDSTTTTSKAAPPISKKPLMISHPNTEPSPRIPHMLLR
jgi:hypothetical protein